MGRMRINDPEISSSSFVKCFDFNPDPLAWSSVLQTLISVSNTKDLPKEVPKLNISGLESVLKDVKLLTTFLKGNTMDGNPELSNDYRSNNIKLSDDYAEDEIESLKIISTCLVPESNNFKMDIGLQEGPSLTKKVDAIMQEVPLVSENDNSDKMDIGLQEGPLTKKGDAIMEEVPLVSENDNSVVQNVASFTEKGDNILHEGPLISKNNNSIVQDVPLVPTNSNDILGKAPPVTENGYGILQDSCPIDENGNTNMPKDLPVMENADQIMPKGQQINQICDAYMPKVHPGTENGDENIPKQYLITENSNGIMQGPSFAGNVNRNLQVPPATEDDDGGILHSNFCLKCHRGGSLIMCEVENCYTSFHERCVVYLERNELGTFKCPLCFYKHAAMEYQVAKKRYSQAKKSLAYFLVKDEMGIRIDKRKSTKANGDMNASSSNRKRRKKSEIQVKVEAVETKVFHNGSEANSVQEQVTENKTVTLDKGKTKADVIAISTINDMHEKGETTITQSKDTPQEVLNMPIQKARAKTLPNEGGRNPHISNSENQHTGMNSISQNGKKSSCYDTSGNKRSIKTNEHQGRFPKQCKEKTFR